ncbi:hypothetical protein J3Q64DRAFT_1697263 [Phycomyces blakesleeanus]|uniref:Retrotransposon gag domain-containing protein n=1 Tax=Phycomyces blakesleeanus TaxID=4837 RepID=A0ABR3B513_PHYBL
MNNSDSQVLKSIQREIDVTNALLNRLQQYQRCNMFQDPKVSPDGISISFRNIPKFQIMGNNSTIWYHTSYQCFKKILTAGKTNIDSAWKICLPMSFDHDHDTWYKSNLQGKDISWNDVKDIITKKFDSFDRQLEMASLVFTRIMGPNKSILDYGIKFQKACREGGVKENANLAMRFMSSLTPELSSNVKLAWFARYSEMPQTIKQVLLLANGISTSNKRSNPYDNCNNNCNNRKSNLNITNKGKYFCTQHMFNDMHVTSNCRMLQKHKHTDKTCRYCNKPWQHHHTCQEYLQAKTRTVNAIGTTQENITSPINHITQTLENASFGKLNNNKQKDKMNSFSLYTPILLQNEYKIQGLIDTGAQISCLSL